MRPEALPTGTRIERFIYYRVSRADATQAEATALAFQASLRLLFPSIEARLMRRADALTASEVTLMEHYADTADVATTADWSQITPAIEAAAEALRPWLIGERHCEAFEALGST
jgi:hypothetical protein